MMNVLNTLKNHWKKSVFIIAGGAYGVSYATDKWRDWNLMKGYCLEAKKFGDVILKSSNRPKRVTVILNPAANKGRGKSVYEKNVAPILHLAGMEVNLLMTQYEGHAKKMIAELDKADAVIIAGGDGTLSEAVTGLLRRSDEASLSAAIPWCVIPLGRTNSLARLLYAPKTENKVQFIADMAMSSISGPTVRVDVMQIKGDDGKSVCALSSLSMGAFSDSEIRKKKNWYFGPLKDRLCYVLTTIRHWNDLINCKLTYTLPCSGCNRCKSPPQKLQWSWSHIFIRPKYEPCKDYTDVNNDLCMKAFELGGDFAQMDLVANGKVLVHDGNVASTSEWDEKKSIKVSMVSSSIDRRSFIEKGWERMNKDGQLDESETNFEANTIELKFNESMEGNKMIVIDNEQFEAKKSLVITLLSDKLKFYYCPKETISTVSI